MKKALLILFCTIQSVAFGHDYFFAFAELKYDDFSRTFEASISASGHDLDRIFEEKSWSLDELSNISPDSEDFAEISTWILTHFNIKAADVLAEFTLIGCETELNGQVHFYFESKPIEIDTNLTVSFNFLMPEFPQQQNKLTFFYRDQTITTTFLPSGYTHEIRLVNA